jgi:hypothetical protein
MTPRRFGPRKGGKCPISYEDFVKLIAKMTDNSPESDLVKMIAYRWVKMHSERSEVMTEHDEGTARRDMREYTTLAICPITYEYGEKDVRNCAGFLRRPNRKKLCKNAVNYGPFYVCKWSGPKEEGEQG